LPPGLGGMTAMTAGLAGQQQARPARRAARQSTEPGPRHGGSGEPDGRSEGEVPRVVKLECTSTGPA
jgi:hypothetical protein